MPRKQNSVQILRSTCSPVCGLSGGAAVAARLAAEITLEARGGAVGPRPSGASGRVGLTGSLLCPFSGGAAVAARGGAVLRPSRADCLSSAPFSAPRIAPSAWSVSRPRPATRAPSPRSSRTWWASCPGAATSTTSIAWWPCTTTATRWVPAQGVPPPPRQHPSLEALLEWHPGASGGLRGTPRLPWWLNGEESSCSAGDAGLIPGWGRSPGGGHGNHSGSLAWRVPQTGESAGLRALGSQRVRHD